MVLLKVRLLTNCEPTVGPLRLTLKSRAPLPKVALSVAPGKAVLALQLVLVSQKDGPPVVPVHEYAAARTAVAVMPATALATAAPRINRLRLEILRTTICPSPPRVCCDMVTLLKSIRNPLMTIWHDRHPVFALQRKPEATMVRGFEKTSAKLKLRARHHSGDCPETTGKNISLNFIHDISRPSRERERVKGKARFRPGFSLHFVFSHVD